MTAPTPQPQTPPPARQQQPVHPGVQPVATPAPVYSPQANMTSPQQTTAARSHVTAVPPAPEGHNFNAQLRSQYANEPGVVHASRPLEPTQNQISPELRAKHERSVAEYPFLNLTEGEYVILRIQRHPIGLLAPVGISSFLIILLLSVLFSYPMILADSPSEGALPGFGVVALITLALSVLVGIFCYIAVWVYLRNQFFLTNESVIQELQYSLFSKHEQTASLGSIEDVSYRQNGILQVMLNYGSIRLSTEGEETTYRFYYVSNPKQQTSILTNAVEAFKNGRPVGD